MSEKEEKNELEKKSDSLMEYRYLGNTGLKVSILSFGNSVNNRDDQLTLDCLKYALANGINYFDTAEIYGMGTGESNLGKALKELNISREKIVVSTKIFRSGSDPNDCFLSRKHIIEGIYESLERLKLDYIDIVYAHRYDLNTPLEETCRAMNWLIKNELCYYWGTSEWTAGQIMEAIKICNRLNLEKPVVDQCHYNMFTRINVETKYGDLIKKFKFGIAAFSPLESGILTGKYINEIPKDSRAHMTYDNANSSMDRYIKEKKSWDEKMLKLKDIAEKKINCTLAQLCIAWVIANKDVSTCILGASKLIQLEENINALKIYKNIDKETWIEIEKILDNVPEGEKDFRNKVTLCSRRNIVMGIDFKK
jgi:voltage-dependent potassium channel beta subunit